MLAIIVLAGCNKNSGTTPPPPPPCDGFCKLTSSKWRIVSSKVTTDAATYTSDESQLIGIPWSTFLFKEDSTYVDFTGETGPYTYKESDNSLKMTFTGLPLSFTVPTLLQTSLTLMGDKVYMNPQTDTSASTNFAIQEIAGGLHDDFGVDTSQIHFFQASWSYNH